ncbi:peptidase S8/S53 domain-containing protein [Bipolaris maydis]|nr:peptidase S8/S53 domain-containing protein [Bipolaris maydis]KAJ6207349.1 peptidase S8/S53 domain-containing protein [Bipolaris maydis]
MLSIAIFLLSNLATLASTFDTYVLHERRSANLPEWVKRHSAEDLNLANSSIPISIALAQRNLEEGEKWLLEVSNPNSDSYGKHWSPKDVAAAFAPSHFTLEPVKTWLNSVGIITERIEQSQSLGWLRFNATIDQAERLLKTKYHIFTHKKTNQLLLACDEYSIPAGLRDKIDLITPTVHFDVQSEARYARMTFGKHSGNPLNLRVLEENRLIKSQITPQCLRQLYQFPKGSSANPNNSLGVVEFTPGAYRPSDLDLFFANFSPSQIGARPIFHPIQGGVNQLNKSGPRFNAESDMNLAYTMSLVYPQQVTLFQVGDIVQGGSGNSFLDGIDASYCLYEGGDDPALGGYKSRDCGIFPPTKVISTSYHYDEIYLGPAYMRRQCYEYMKLGLMGVTMLFSSGDDGVAGGGGRCIDELTGKLSDGNLGGRFACQTEIISGGGFSDVFPIPQYQVPAVESYLTNHMPSYTAHQYNSTQQSRGYPDLSANGADYAIAIMGKWTTIYGTSCSTPTVASIITLINEARYNAGKVSVGFINPVLYANPQMFNDIKEGHNPGCNTSGFAAAPGWDPLTGMGTPIFPKMLEVFMALP